MQASALVLEVKPMSDFELDWRERPMMSPFGGFLIQSRGGHNGNFEVVIAWPDGGLAHLYLIYNRALIYLSNPLSQQ